MEAPGTLREVRSWEEALAARDADVEIFEAMLLTVGEHGYEGATVQEVCSRARISADRLQRRFGGKEGCFAEAYADAADRLCSEVLTSCENAESWRDGFEAGLSTLLRFVAEQPLLAKALLIEVRAARGEAWVTHQNVVQRFVDALDSARHEPGARAAAAPMTAGFIVGAIEESLCIDIGAGRTTDIEERLLKDLTHLAILQLFGTDRS
jgi:AcrR family transcriptional regulator